MYNQFISQRGFLKMDMLALQYTKSYKLFQFCISTFEQKTASLQEKLNEQKKDILKELLRLTVWQ